MHDEGTTSDCNSLSLPKSPPSSSLPRPRRRRRRLRPSSLGISDGSVAGQLDYKTTATSPYETNPNDWYRCPLCKYKVRRRAVFQIHIFSHREDFQRCNFDQTNFENGVEAFSNELKLHTLPSVGKLLYCPKCDYKTNRKFNLESHLLRHSKSKVAKCPNCHYKTINKRFFNIHKRNCTMKEPKNSHNETQNTFTEEHSSPEWKSKLFRCAYCVFVSKKQSTLERHLLEHSEINVSNATPDFSILRSKLLEEHSDVKQLNGTGTYPNLEGDSIELPDVSLNTIKDPFDIKSDKSVHSEGQSTTKSDLLEHFDVQAKSHLLEPSDVNLNSMPRQSTLRHNTFEPEGKPINSKKKRRLFENRASKRSEGKLFKCSKCSYVSLERCELKAHLRTHKITKFKCSQCEFVTNRNSSLKKHLKEHIPEKQYKCKECSYETNEKGNFKNHMLIHSTSVYKCPDCSYECNVERYLKIHSVVHLPEEQYLKCSKCSYKTPRKTELKIHFLKHSSVKMFKCSKCKFETNRKNSLKIHALSHSDKKLFKCESCSYATNQRSNLKIHLLNHLKLKMFKCSHCKYETNHASHFKRHYLKHC